MLSFITNPRKAFHFSRGERQKSSPHLTPRHLSFSRPRLHFLPPRHPFRLRLRSFLHAAAVRRSKLGSPSVSPSLPLCGCICGDPNNKTSTCINLTGRNLTGLTLCATAVHFHVEKMEKSTEGKRWITKTHIKIHRHASRRLCKVCLCVCGCRDSVISVSPCCWCIDFPWNEGFIFCESNGFLTVCLPSCEKMTFLFHKILLFMSPQTESKLDLVVSLDIRSQGS